MIEVWGACSLTGERPFDWPFGAGGCWQIVDVGVVRAIGVGFHGEEFSLFVHVAPASCFGCGLELGSKRRSLVRPIEAMCTSAIVLLLGTCFRFLIGGTSRNPYQPLLKMRFSSLG